MYGLVIRSITVVFEEVFKCCQIYGHGYFICPSENFGIYYSEVGDVIVHAGYEEITDPGLHKQATFVIKLVS